MYPQTCEMLRKRKDRLRTTAGPIRCRLRAPITNDGVLLKIDTRRRGNARSRHAEATDYITVNLVVVVRGGPIRLCGKIYSTTQHVGSIAGVVASRSAEIARAMRAIEVQEMVADNTVTGTN